MKKPKKKNTPLVSNKGIILFQKSFLKLSATTLCLLGTVPCIVANPTTEHLTIAQNIQKTKTIKGLIVDEAGLPMIGVSVVAKGTTTGTITDFDGNFSIEIPTNVNILDISYIGYIRQAVKINNNTSLKITLKEDTQNLEEVVVIGYGTIKKRDLTGAVASVKSEDITLNPGTNPMQSLQGRVAGLDITTSSGQPGSAPEVQLRGNRSFSASGKPLYIIDGIQGDISTINPNDIESIEVLKDASSTAVYGSVGANGVIIVTTKSAKEGKTNVNLNAYMSVNAFPMLPEMRTGESYIQTLRDANTNMGINWTSPEDDVRLFSSEEAYKAHQDGKYINWADELMQTAISQNYSLSVSGGTEKTKGYFSLNFTDDNGQYRGDNYKVYSSNVRVDHKISSWLKAGINLQASYVHQNRAYAKLVNALTSVPLGEVYDEKGNININPVIGDGNYVSLLLNTQKGVYKDQVQNSKFSITPYLEINPVKGLTFTSRLNAKLYYSRSNYFQGIGSQQYYEKHGANGKGTSEIVFARVNENRFNEYLWENIATYNFTIANDHDITVVGATSWNHERVDKISMKQDNITDNKYLWHNISDKASSISTSNYSMKKKLGFIGRFNYSYLGRYLFSASVRQDGASVLAKGNRWATYPAVSAGWRISDERFMESSKNWLDNLKLRVGYGKTGMADIAPFSSASSLQQGYTSLGGEQVMTYYYSKKITNKDLTWENSYNTNIGLDLSLFNGRVDITADYYHTKTKGVIWDRLLPSTNGSFDATQEYVSTMNICSTKNNGIELAINTRNIVKKNFTWSSTVTFSKNKEEITSLIGGSADNIQDRSTGYTFSVGKPIRSFFNYKIDGIWQKGEEADAAVFGMKPGDLKINIPGLKKSADGHFYKIDEEGDRIEYTADNKYVISDKDYQSIGSNTPKWSLGFQNTLTYKNFDLTIYMFARFGQMIKYDMLGYYDPTGKGNFPTHFNYWTENNPSNDFPAINANRDLDQYTGWAAMNYVDGSFFKIKNITLGYNLPTKYSKKAKIEQFRVYGTVTNPLVIANNHLLKNYDPEMNGSLNFPLTKQFVLGINLTF